LNETPGRVVATRVDTRFLDPTYSGSTDSDRRGLVHPLGRDPALDKIFGIVVMATDITERKQAEEALRESEELFAGAFEEAPIGMALVSLEGRWLKVNRTLRDLVGYTDAEMRTRTLRDLTHPEDLDADLQDLHQLLAGEITSYQVEKRYIHASGRHVNILLSASLVRDSQGAPRCMVSQIQDMTERKRSGIALESSLREKEGLLKEVHHRVKNNLQVITSLLRLEARRSAEPSTKTVLKDMQARIHSMALLHEMLYQTENFARLDLGGYLRRLATQLVRAQNDAPGKVRLALDLSPVQVDIDQAIPAALLVNELLSNSLKHAFPDGRSGELRLALRLDPGSMVRLCVGDTGVGLPPEFEERRTKSLGLKLVSDLARQLGGTLEVGPGGSALFTITFPLTRESDLES
jgi:PAS domain S-box-containing protein